MAERLQHPNEHPALQRNDAYLRSFVEAFDVCPFAKTCRERGRLHRSVLTGSGPELQQAVDAAALALQTGDADVEVALLILPDIAMEPREFEAFALAVSERAKLALQASGQRFAFHVVAFHPRMPFRDDDAFRLVGLMRRSPDPTLQFVRASVLTALKGHAVADKLYVALEDVAHLAPERLEMPRDLSTRIAEANLRTWQAHADVMAPLLASLPGLKRR